MNPAAEKLTGWSRAEAAGRPLGDVFRLQDQGSEGEGGGRALVRLVERCLEEGVRLRLDGRTILAHRGGHCYAIEGSCAPIRDGAEAILGAVIVFQDVSDKRLMALQLAHQATHDELTGLLNRQAFDGHLERALGESRRQGSTHALCYLDLDQFKVVNDTCGHLAGDELLRKVTALLQECLRPEDVAARLGGDELGVLMPRATLGEAGPRIEAFHAALQELRFVWRDKTFAVGASIGIVPITHRFASVAQLLSAADHACYLAKERGRNRLQVYYEDDADFIRRHDEMNWVARIQKTLEEDRFQLVSQAIEPLAPRAPRGLYFEVLLRLVEEDGEVHLPSDFLRAAERYGLMRAIDRWVIRHTLDTLASRPAAWLDRLATCAVNLSAVSLGDDDFLPFVEEALERSSVPPEKICFEITETAAIENLGRAGRLFARLARRGVRFALDDFGTGMSSYGYLREIPVSVLKIDGKFVQDMVTDPLDHAMVESINQVGHVMGLATVAEAVGSAAVVDRLRALGVDYAQGHWIGVPRPLLSARAAAVSG
jgi:diguanylate cyclase (GGDEF)-like protein/PAS domain S-box-containing protein